MYPPDKPEKEPQEAIKRLHKNLEEEPLVKKIKHIEGKLLVRRGDYFKDYTMEEKVQLKELLKLFEELLQTKYGALNYILKTMPNEIEALYNVNTSIDFTVDLDEVRMRIPNPVLDGAIAAGGWRSLIGEEPKKVYSPEEDARNEKITDKAIEEIVESIKKILSGDDKWRL
ncbi:MAG TPA: hypothetical protein VNF06_00625 [Candidatus Aquilonibacter sp.]|nr:hypothetical protein [Candidatus Aquilonibacter sp.]